MAQSSRRLSLVSVAWRGQQYFYVTLDGMQVQHRVTVTPSIMPGCHYNFSDPSYTPGWNEALWEWSVLPKTTTQCPRSGLEPGLYDPEFSASPALSVSNKLLVWLTLIVTSGRFANKFVTTHEHNTAVRHMNRGLPSWHGNRRLLTGHQWSIVDVSTGWEYRRSSTEKRHNQ